MDKNFIDYYLVLEITPKATVTEIKSAYRRLAKRYHPDVNKSSDAHEKFILINEAYLVLSNTSTREEYDLLYNFYFKNEGSYTETQRRAESFNSTKSKAEQKANEIAKLSLKDILESIKLGSRDAGDQLFNTILYTVLGLLLYNILDVVFVQEPNIGKIVICSILALPISIILFKRKFL